MSGKKDNSKFRAGVVVALVICGGGVAMGQSNLPRPANDSMYYPRNEAKEELGRLLFYDKIISGNMNISCASCHHPITDTGDGLSLPVGEGGRGLGVSRDTGFGANAIHERVPRNAPHVFNLGAREFNKMFYDGRVEVDPNHPSGFMSPAGDQLPPGLDNVLAVQAMFPVTSATEMAGQGEENPIAQAAAAGRLAGEEGVWNRLARRLQAIPQYVGMFLAAFPEIGSAEEITFVHAANAIAAYEAAAFRADNSPFDRYLRGEREAMSRAAERGMRLFYGSAGCASCHSGTFQTNQDFASIGMPQIGPGKGDNLPGFDDGRDDFGRERVTGNEADRFHFRVPTLRNVALTGPWGHDGAYNTLEGVVRHHLSPLTALNNYDMSQAVLPPRKDLDAQDFAVQQNGTRRGSIAKSCELPPQGFSASNLKSLIEFLQALTDPASLDLRSEFPMEVPSGLPVFD